MSKWRRRMRARERWPGAADLLLQLPNVRTSTTRDKVWGVVPSGIRSEQNMLSALIICRVGGDVANPHPSQSTTCRFPASGSLERFARGSVATDDLRTWEWVALEKFVQAAPLNSPLTSSPRQPILPYPQLVGIPTQSSAIATDTVVGAVTSNQ